MLQPRTSLKVILVIAIAGLLFSGYLSYNELFLKSCSLGCSSVGGILGIPVCVFGFVMYLLITVTTFMGLTGKNKKAE